MSKFIKKMEKSEFRVLIKFYFLRKKAAKLDKYFPDSAPSIQTIHKWFADFLYNRTGTVEAPRSGRPNEVTTTENVDKIHDKVLEDPKIKLKDLAKALDISMERVGNIMHSVFGMKKLCAQ